MVSPRQGDLFAGDQPDPSDEDFETPVYEADPEEVRAELHRILAEVRAAKTMPWDDSKVSLYRTIFPQMANWLPEEERTQLCFEFETQMERLKAA
jgi:hypothetical protein